MSVIKLGSKMFTIGSVVTLNAKAVQFIPGIYSGIKIVLQRVNHDTIGLYSPDRAISGWSDLDGEVPPERGWWIHKEQLEKCIEEAGDVVFEVRKEFVYCGVDLKGKACQIVARFGDGKTVFAEFDEHVNGCSADGMGKAGHCVSFNENFLTIKKREKHAK